MNTINRDDLLNNFENFAANPILSVPGCALRDPALYYHAGEFHLYSSLITGLYGDTQEWYIGHVKTRDFILYSEITHISPVGYASPEACFAMVDGGTYYLFYKGVRSIGLWVSEDLKSWRDLTPDKPLIERGPEQWSHGVENPCVIKVDGTYYLFYVSTGKFEGEKQNRFYFRTSEDLSRWSDCRTIELPTGPWSEGFYNALFFMDVREICGIFIVVFHSGDDPSVSGPHMSGLGMGWSADFREWRFLEYGDPRIRRGSSR